MTVKDTPVTNTTGTKDAAKAPLIGRHFTGGQHPFEQVPWNTRDAVIPGRDGNVFEQRGVEFPEGWSQNATNIVAQKYFRGQMGAPEREFSVKQMIGRVVDTITGWGVQGGYFPEGDEAETFRHELAHLLVEQKMAFNSPVWFNVGHEKHPQGSACFILSVEDNMDSILEWIRKEGIVFKGGSGSGINLSNIRSSIEQLSKGGNASGPVSFMRGADASAGTIKSGGKTRRAAKMVVLNIDHPDIEEFIWCKAREEEKARALAAVGYDMALDSDNWNSIQYQNANNSVRVTDDFMRSFEVNGEWSTRARVTGDVVKTYSARDLMHQIAEAAWKCADPGVQFDTTINDWHTCPSSGRINGSNPCFPAEALVHTTRGLMAIGELYERAQAGDAVRVYTHRATAGTPGKGVAASTPIAVMNNGTKPIVRLRFEHGHEVRCTPNHRFWTLNRGYVAAEDLTADDHVLLNDSPTPADDASWTLPATVAAEAKTFRKGGTVTYLPLPTSWSAGLGTVLGHLVGDGCMTDSGLVWVYGGDDIDDTLIDQHEEILRELFGGVSMQEMGNGTMQLCIGSGAVREMLSQLGMTTARAHEKRVPGAVYGAPIEVQASFLRGLFGADGCVSRLEDGKASRYVGLGSTSEQLLQDVQRLLGGFGVRSRIYRQRQAVPDAFAYTRVDGTEAHYDAQAPFDLRITGSDLERFASSIGFSTPRKQEQLESLLAETGRYATKAYATLESRADEGSETVYNLTEPLHHSYIVNGMVVANCSEYMHVDNSACNLASLNLMKFLRDDDVFDIDAYEQAIDVTITAQEILVGFSSYPTPEITRNAKAMRQLGLGYANLGALLMANGIPYDSDEGRAYAGALTAVMTGRAYRQSARVAERMGAYDEYGKNADAHIRVVEKHRAAVSNIDARHVPEHVMHAARRAWDEALEFGRQHGYRNAQATVLAPTGTISFMMDCDTTGIEPDFSLVKSKKLVGGGDMVIVNQTVPRALAKLGYASHEIDQIVAYIQEHNAVVGAPILRPEHFTVFDCAVGDRAIPYMGHVTMMGAAQPFISGAISKTVNMPEAATVEDVMELYVEAWRLGIKALAIYRDNCKVAQPLSSKGDSAQLQGTFAEPIRRQMPLERTEVGRKFQVGDYEGYIHVGLYEDGTPGDVFVDIAKEGTTLAGLMNSLMISVSLGLQYGVPLEVYVSKFSHMRFEPSGFTNDTDIRNAKSIVDYIFRWLGKRFLDVDTCMELGILTPEVKARLATQYANAEAAPVAAVEEHHAPPAGQTALFNAMDDAQECARCGGRKVRTGACYTCMDCGDNTGCG